VEKKFSVNQITSITSYQHHIACPIGFPCGIVIALSQELQIVPAKEKNNDLK